jgi:hypothetical protein
MIFSDTQDAASIQQQCNVSSDRDSAVCVAHISSPLNSNVNGAALRVSSARTAFIFSSSYRQLQEHHHQCCSVSSIRASIFIVGKTAESSQDAAAFELQHNSSAAFTAAAASLISAVLSSYARTAGVV